MTAVSRPRALPLRAAPIPLAAPDYGHVGASAAPITVVARVLDEERVMAAFASLLDELVTLRGTLDELGGDRLGFVDGGPGPAVSRVRLPSAVDARDANALWTLVDPVRSVPGEPLCRLRLIDTPAEKLVAISVSHAAFDGVGFGRLLLEWDRRARGLAPMRLAEDRAPVNPRGAGPAPGLTYDDQLRRFMVKPTVAQASDPFGGRFATDFILDRELRAEEERLREEGDPDDASDHEIVSAMLVKRRAAALARPAPIAVVCPVGLRCALPGVTPMYLGNAYLRRLVWIAPRDVEAPSVAAVVRKIRDSQRHVDVATITSTLRRLESWCRDQDWRSCWASPAPEHLAISNMTTSTLRSTVRGGGEALLVPLRNLTPAANVTFFSILGPVVLLQTFRHGGASRPLARAV